MLWVGCGQARGVAWALDDHLLIRQAPEHPADYRAADPEGIAKRLFGQGAARGQALFEDGIEQARVDLLGRQSALTLGEQRGQGGVMGVGAGVHGRTPGVSCPDDRPGCSVRYPCAGLPGGYGGASARWPGRCSCCGWRAPPLRFPQVLPPDARASCAALRRFA
ncbi:hypothetical protein D3C80_1316790 [compost metagenome]